MKLRVNSQEVETEVQTLQEFSQELELASNDIAIAVNNRMIPRAEWESFTLGENDSIIIIKAVCGG